MFEARFEGNENLLSRGSMVPSGREPVVQGVGDVLENDRSPIVKRRKGNNMFK